MAPILVIASSLNPSSALSCESIHSPAMDPRSGIGKPVSLPAAAATLSTVSPSLMYGIALTTHSLGNVSSKPSASPLSFGCVLATV